MPDIIKDDRYELLLENIKATLVEKSFEERMAKIEMYHVVGELLRTAESDITALTKEVSKDLNLSERSLWFAVKFYDTYPTLESLPDGKAVSWNKVKALLSDGSKKEDTLDLDKVAKGLIKRYGQEDAISIAELTLRYTRETA
jgi:hypothetical protein